MWLKQRVILFGCVILVCLTITECSKRKKVSGGVKTKKTDKDIKKKVSSSKVPNGGRTGPMSGSWDSTLSISTLPAMIPIPKKNSKKKKKQKKANNVQTKNTRTEEKEKNKPRRKEADMNPKAKRSVIDLYDDIIESHDDIVARIKREVDDSVFTEEEKRMRDEWFRLDEKNNIPSVETASFVPNDLKYIYDAGKTLAEAYETLTRVNKEHLQQKRSVEESEEDEDPDKEEREIKQEEDSDDQDQAIDKRDVTDYDLVADEDIMSENVARDMRVREISPEDEVLSDDVMEIIEEPNHYHTIVTRDVPLNGNCKAEEEQVENAIKASKVVDNIVEQLGIKKENIIEDTRKCIEETQKMKRDFNERFRRHVIHARDLVDAPKHRRAEIMELKEMFDQDQKEGEKISAESELCAKIEMQVTILETAEYYALSNAKKKLASCRSGQPVNLSPGVVSFAEMKAGQGSPVPSLMSAQHVYSEPQPAPMVATITLQAPQQPAVRLPALSSFFQPSQTQQQSGSTHEIGMQRHFDSAPNPAQSSPSILYQPHIASHMQPQVAKMQNYEVQKMNYGQPLAYNRFANYGEMVRQNYQMFKAPSPQQKMFESNHGIQEQPQYQPVINAAILNFMQQKQAPVRQPPSVAAFLPQPPVAPLSYPQQQQQQFVVADQKHITSRPYITQPYPIINSFANKDKNKLSHPDHHHSTTDSDEDKEDWHSSLWFPGTTYSPPPSWMQAPIIHETSSKQPSVPIQQQQSQAPQSPEVPVLPFIPKIQEIHPVINEIAGDKHKEGEPGMVAPYSSLKPYIPSKQSPQIKQDIAPYSSLKPYAPYKQQQLQGFVSPQPASVVINTPAYLSPIINTYASPQQGGHEVLRVGPTQQVMTVNQQQPQPGPKSTGNLPGWLGSVDVLKLPDDASERLRGDGSENNKNKNNNKDGNKNSNDAPKREFSNRPETSQDVEKAVESVNYIKKSIGTPPKGIELLIDSVKENVKKDVKLSKDVVTKDKKMESENCDQQPNPDNVAQKSELDKRSEIRTMACENVRKMLSRDETSLKEALERERTIAEIEMKETVMEAAQYFAQISKDGNAKNIDLADLTRASRSSPLYP